eukprot:CAMPEP_0174383048 /NCGR_PEP_ID=MMETSP0811_2-20130205/124971_1 /TAXON_ID=73025 ORGANISM="Eutreptiella gymnastica-like, Strain CCMP1594" /NCGR_SAMPLE_ID=MMETSP0811_2 /ASSEMBLY_ACC=CAM_ASM_000667 /LENGTH=91 /DNA_ID=CAMNT_0015536497 /DNA_START=1231 /DNA_END=1504 /DNA_ORIENTATION=+
MASPALGDSVGLHMHKRWATAVANPFALEKWQALAHALIRRHVPHNNVPIQAEFIFITDHVTDTCEGTDKQNRPVWIHVGQGGCCLRQRPL